jgi:hypothetical protein
MRLTEEQRTGTLFCVTDNEDSATIAIQKGIFVSLSFKLTQGTAALEAIRNISRCRTSFKERLVLRFDATLPSNCDILRSLDRDMGALPSRKSSVVLLDNRVLRHTLKTEALVLFGPIGNILCEEHLRHVKRLQTRDDLRRFLRALATAVGEPEHTGTLIASVLDKVGGDERARQRRATSGAV